MRSPPVSGRAAAMAAVLAMAAVALLTVASSEVKERAASFLAIRMVPRHHLADGTLDERRPAGPLTILVIGSDSRVGASPELPALGHLDGARADVVSLWLVHDDGVRVLALPRDLRVHVPGHGAVKLGGTRELGVEALVDATRRITGMPIHHVVEIGFDGFVAAVDAVGGVDVLEPRAVRDRFSGLALPSGATRLNGVQALQLARSRNLEALEGGTWTPAETGDIARLARQQELVGAVARRFDDVGLLARLRLAHAVSAGLWVDDRVDMEDLRMLARASAGLDDPTSVELCVLPTHRQLPDDRAVSPFPPAHPGSAVFRVPESEAAAEAVRWLGAAGDAEPRATCPGGGRHG